MPDNCPYEKNDKFLISKHNITFGDAASMSDANFRKWCIEIRKEITRAWDKDGMPPVVGRSADDIVKDFRNLATRDISKMLVVDELTLKQDCILNNTTIGSTCNQFFPTMHKTKDITTNDLEGTSIYDTYAKKAYLDAFVKGATLQIRDDGRYLYSHKVEKNTHAHAVAASTGANWIKEFTQQSGSLKQFDYWLQKMTDKKRYKGRAFLTLSKTELLELINDKIVEPHNIARLQLDDDETSQRYRIRLYKTNTRVFPIALDLFRLMTIMPATNFPPLTARFIYEHFTQHISDKKRITVYDPSAGWGGRVLAAMATHNNRSIHYVGTDPNSAHWIDELEMTKYEYVADYFNSNINGANSNTCELFTVGSEVIHKEPRFKKYKGKLDFVFTSPPYFAAEGYSDEETQSLHKFPTYDEWRDGFLYQTLKTAADWLAHDRYLCLNIADVIMNNRIVPLQRDTVAILEGLGLENRGVLKMVLAPLKGTASSDFGGLRNFCKIGNKFRKFEPVFVFYKN